MMNIKTQIKSTFSENQQVLIHKIADISGGLGYPIYLVGGSVRDLMLGRPVSDIDFTLEGDSKKLAKALSGKFGGKVVVHSKFGTARWTLDESSFEKLGMSGNSDFPDFIDFVSTRSETYEKPGVLPTVTSSTIEDDLNRRDFTINAMAIRLDGGHFGELLDPLNGRDDLEKNIIRVLHSRSFMDDPTRIFRAIRYEGRYSFKIDSSTEGLVNSESLHVFSKLSGERIRHELDLIFAEKLSPVMIDRAGQLGLFKYIHPNLPLFDKSYSNFLDAKSNLDFELDREVLGYIFWLIDLSKDAIISISKRLDFSSNLTQAVAGASKLWKMLPKLTGSKPSEWTFELDKFPVISVYAISILAEEDAPLEYLTRWRFVKPQTTGDDLLRMGLPRGPLYGEILTRLRAARLDGEVKNDEQERELLRFLLNKPKM